MRGIILAGGSGTRLYPITKGVSKQLLPIYDEPLIYYPPALLISAGTSKILVITTSEDQSQFRLLLGGGPDIRISLFYAEQHRPGGLAEDFLIGADFLSGDSALVLGDNIFYGAGLHATLKKCTDVVEGHMRIYHFANPSAYGVTNSAVGGKVPGISEKPLQLTSSYAVPGLYFYDTAAKTALPASA